MRDDEWMVVSVLTYLTRGVSIGLLRRICYLFLYVCMYSYLLNSALQTGNVEQKLHLNFKWSIKLLLQLTAVHLKQIIGKRWHNH